MSGTNPINPNQPPAAPAQPQQPQQHAHFVHPDAIRFPFQEPLRPFRGLRFTVLLSERPVFMDTTDEKGLPL